MRGGRGMSEIIELTNYAAYKQALDKQMKESAEGFVRIGYLLKLAKDTDILKDSGYANVNDFAKAEYGIDKTMVSRFININDRFSEGGNSPLLRTEYQGFGYAKLAIMLQLPDELNEVLTPDFSKREIQALKEEIDEEKKISDLEVMIEQPIAKEMSEIEEVAWKILEENPETFTRVYMAVVEERAKDMVELFAPAGEMIYSIRIPGKGRYAVSFKAGEPISAINLRSSEKTVYEVSAFAETVQNLIYYAPFPEKDARVGYENIFETPFPLPEKEEKLKVAPVQQEKPSTNCQKEKRLSD